MTWARRVALCGGAVLALLLISASLSSFASAVGAEQIVQGRYLHIVSSMSEGADRLSPGEDALWTVGISAAGVEEGRIDRTLVVDGSLASAVRVSIESCTAPPTARECPGATALQEDLTPTAGHTIDLGAQDAAVEAWLRVRVTMSSQAPRESQALAGSLRLHVRGAGEHVTAAPPGADGGTGSGDAGSGTVGSGTAAGPASTTPEGSSGADASAGTGTSSGASSSARGDGGEQGPASHGLPGPLAATGSELLPWLLAVAALVLVGAHLRRGRKA